MEPKSLNRVGKLFNSLRIMKTLDLEQMSTVQAEGCLGAAVGLGLALAGFVVTSGVGPGAWIGMGSLVYSSYEFVSNCSETD